MLHHDSSPLLVHRRCSGPQLVTEMMTILKVNLYELVQVSLQRMQGGIELVFFQRVLVVVNLYIGEHAPHIGSYVGLYLLQEIPHNVRGAYPLQLCNVIANINCARHRAETTNSFWFHGECSSLSFSYLKNISQNKHLHFKTLPYVSEFIGGISQFVKISK